MLTSSFSVKQREFYLQQSFLVQFNLGGELLDLFFQLPAMIIQTIRPILVRNDTATSMKLRNHETKELG